MGLFYIHICIYIFTYTLSVAADTEAPGDSVKGFMVAEIVVDSVGLCVVKLVEDDDDSKAVTPPTPTRVDDDEVVLDEVLVVEELSLPLLPPLLPPPPPPPPPLLLPPPLPPPLPDDDWPRPRVSVIVFGCKVAAGRLKRKKLTKTKIP